MFPGLSGTGVNTGESSQRLAVRKTCNVTDLSHKLWAESGADAVHCHDNRVFREGGSGLIHLLAEGFHGCGCGIEHCHCLPYQHFCSVILREYRDQVRRSAVYCLRLAGAEIITFPPAPVLVMLCKGFRRPSPDTVHMPVGVDKIHPFLAAVTAGRAVKEVIGAGIGLVKECNEVVFHCGLMVHVEAELPVHGFKLVANFIHMVILLQICPAVKCIPGDFLCIGLIGFRRAQGIIAKLLDKDGIDRTDKDTGIREP